MACYHPISALLMVNPQTGERKLNFNPNPNYSYNKFCRYVQIPCGQCIGCRLDYARQWSARCMLEASYYDWNWFLTLTYDDLHLAEKTAMFPCRQKVKGEFQTVMKEVAPLYPEDLTLFLKRLRMHFKRKHGCDNIRFFACGEYGDKSGRPHFHIILFNCPIFDLKESVRMRGKNTPLFESQEISDIWNKGLVAIGQCNYQTCNYVSRYIMKKHKGKSKDFYEKNGLTPEFVRMSRKPGIGKRYYDENKEHIYSYDCLYIVDKDNNPVKLRPPRYFDSKFEEEHPGIFDFIKSQRFDTADSLQSRLLDNTDKNICEYNLVREENKLFSLSKLTRLL